MAEALTAAVGTPLARLEAAEKVTGGALYAHEHRHDDVAYAWIVGAQVASGEIRHVDVAAALACPEAIAALWHENAPRLQPVDNAELAVLQSARVSYRGQAVAVVIAETLESAREAAELVRIDYDERPHDVQLRADHPARYRPDHVNPRIPADTNRGDVDAALASAPVRVVQTYATPAFHNNALEPHATLAVWRGEELTLYDSNQGAPLTRDTVAKVLGIEPERVRVISPHVGGGFGSKGTPRPSVIIAALAARLVGRPVKLAVTRQQMFAITGYRTPTIQRVSLGAERDGRLIAIAHDVVEQTSKLHEFGEQTAVATRMMYAAPNRRTSHRLVRLDVPTPSWMRAPGECPGMFALESAIDELSIACDIDPIELRIRNEPDVDPERGIPFSSRNLIACLREGAARFGWASRDPTPGMRREGRLLVGSGVAASTYPAVVLPARARARADADGSYTVQIGAADIGTGARTALTQIAADTLAVDPQRVRLELGDSALPRAFVAGGSSGTASWGWAVLKACRALRAALAAQDGEPGPNGIEVQADIAEDLEQRAELARHAFGAQFAQVQVDVDTGEVAVRRLLGVFAAGRIVNPRTARSQLVGGMTMGLSMALLEESVIDREFGDFLNHDLAQYHVAVCADVHEIEATWVEEDDSALNPLGIKGIGEIGIVGTAAAIANAVHHATGIRVRELPIRPDRLLAGLSRRSRSLPRSDHGRDERERGDRRRPR